MSRSYASSGDFGIPFWELPEPDLGLVRQTSKFFELYLDLMEDTEPSVQHHLGVGLAILSHLAGGLSHVSYGHMTVPMNLFIGLIAPSGARKTEAIRLGMSLYQELVKQAPEFVKPPLPDISSNVSIMQACDRRVPDRQVSVYLGGEQKTYTSLFMVSSEFGSFIRSRDRDMITFLTNIYDGAVSSEVFSYRTQLGGSFEIINPYAILLMASTPEWLSQALPKQSFQGGFLNRFLFFYADAHRHTAFPQDHFPETLFQEWLELSLWLSSNFYEVKWTEEAKLLFKSWYETSEGGLMGEKDEVLRSWLARIGIFVVKLSGLIAFSDKRLYIEPKDLGSAWQILRFAYQGAKRTLRFTAGNELAWLEERILRILEKEGAVRVPSLCYRLSSLASARLIRDTIEALSQNGLVFYDRQRDLLLKQQINR